MGDITVELHSDMTPEEWDRAMAKLEEFGFATRAEKKGEWIPASEMLPGKSGEYLVTAELENGNVMMLLSWYYFNDNAWSYPNAKVTAWMPLPEPYKGE